MTISLNQKKKFSDVFNTSVNQYCVQKDKNVLKLVFWFYAFHKIPKMLETDRLTESNSVRAALDIF